jgi:hypothetical protein
MPMSFDRQVDILVAIVTASLVLLAASSWESFPSPSAHPFLVCFRCGTLFGRGLMQVITDFSA